MKLTISIVATNEKSLLNKCLDSLSVALDQHVSYEIIVIDNASTDGTSEMLKSNFPEVKIIRNNEKKGFCQNHNNAIKNSSGECVLILNADIVFTKGFISELMKVIESDRKIGIVAGKLLLGAGDTNEKVIDTTGIILSKSRRASSRGHGEADRGQYDEIVSIFMTDGAAFLCRREMLEDIKLFDEYFDESFYAFKEDQDLCWRARLRGWEIAYTPKAVAYHLRGWGKARQRKTVPMFIRQHSFKNRYLMMLKNDHLMNLILALPFILWFEIKALVYMIFIEQHLLLAWFQVFKLLPLTLRKRKEIMRRSTVCPRDIRKWFK